MYIDTAHASSSSSGAVYVDPPSPSKVLDTEGVRVWWKRDVSTFKSPKTYLKLDILAPKHLLAEHSSPARQHARLVMYVEMVGMRRRVCTCVMCLWV